MKNTNIKGAAFIAAITAIMALTGCGTMESQLFTKTAVVTTNTSPPVFTITDTPTGRVTNQVPGVSILVTNYTLAPSQAATATAVTVGGIPLPYAGTAGAVALWLLSAYAAYRNKKLSAALVSGIDTGRMILQQTPEGKVLDAKFKDALILHQEAAGVLNAASALVNDLTGDTVKPP